ncbi:type I secretion system permease/ATPase [Terrarubrum flagellatum]|uniref:type I secretion system permease/ATPase n=1 Tax=Terrirubrum flagellatum TaxID=2895980 RepID=UPI003144FDD3
MTVLPASSKRLLLQTPARDQFSRALRRSWSAFSAMAMFSGVINLLMLTGSLFMLQVYDRVLPSRSLQTLGALVTIVAILYGVQALLETIRSRMMARVGRRLDEDLAAPTFRAAVSLSLLNRPGQDKADPVRDLDQVRQFVASPGPAALFDLPWAPIYILICFLFHPWLGWLAVGGAIVVTALAIYGEFRARGAVAATVKFGAQRQGAVDGGRRNAEVLATMNLAKRLEQRFEQRTRDYLDAQQHSADGSTTISAWVRGLRMLLQSLVLALAALLAVRQEISSGAIIATSILSSRALAPIDAAVAQWRLFVGARQAIGRLRRALIANDIPEPQTRLPAPRKQLRVEGGFIAPPGVSQPTVGGVHFAVEAGDGLGVVGPSGSGKTTLARALTGVWPLLRGEVTLDGAPLHQFTAADRGAAIGYLPQDVDLFDGTIAENIARFDPDRTDEAVVRAAQIANAHDLILRFPQGYDTRIGEGGLKLSAGQRQRVGLARALYMDPFLVVLDEPYSNLDGEGDAALNKAIASVRERGGVVVMIAHRRSAIGAVNKLVAIIEGRQIAFGAKDEVLAKIAAMHAPPPVSPAPTLHPVVGASMRVEPAPGALRREVKASNVA